MAAASGPVRRLAANACRSATVETAHRRRRGTRAALTTGRRLVVDRRARATAGRTAAGRRHVEARVAHAQRVEQPLGAGSARQRRPAARATSTPSTWRPCCRASARPAGASSGTLAEDPHALVGRRRRLRCGRPDGRPRSASAPSTVPGTGRRSPCPARAGTRARPATCRASAGTVSSIGPSGSRSTRRSASSGSSASTGRPGAAGPRRRGRIASTATTGWSPTDAEDRVRRAGARGPGCDTSPARSTSQRPRAPRPTRHAPRPLSARPCVHFAARADRRRRQVRRGSYASS